MNNPATKLFRSKQRKQIDLNKDILTSNLSELRIKIQCLQKQFLVQSSENVTPGDNAAKVYE